MGIPVHEEIAQHNAVVNTNCIRCLACKNACPNGTLSYRWGVNVISITRRIEWLIPRQGNYGWYCDFFSYLLWINCCVLHPKVAGEFSDISWRCMGVMPGYFHYEILRA